MDYSKFKFDESKKRKDQKRKPLTSKEIRLRPVSSDHDVGIKIKQLRKFLEEKRIVLVSVLFSNRELHYKDQGFNIIHKIVDAVTDIGKLDQSPRFEGKRLTVRLSSK
jgi:translation initiation factor IF-3